MDAAMMAIKTRDALLLARKMANAAIGEADMGKAPQRTIDRLCAEHDRISTQLTEAEAEVERLCPPFADARGFED